MHRHTSRLAAGVSLVALFALALPAQATIITTGTVANPVNAAGDATAAFIGIGHSGTGAVSVFGGSVLTMAPSGGGAGQINIGGDQSGATSGTGDVTVRGVGSRIEFTGTESILIVGRWGAASNASLNILEGGVVNMTAGFGVRLGRGASEAGAGTDGASGIARVDGAGSVLSISGQDSSAAAAGIVVGRDQGFGRLTISNGGVVTVDTTSTTSSAFLTVGGRQPTSDPTLAPSSGSGEVTITGAGSTLRLGGAGAGITVGNFGSTSTATMSVNGGGRAESTFLSTGVGNSGANGTTGTTIIDGTGSKILLSGRGRAGEAPGGTVGDDLGRGTMIIRNGANLSLDAGSATLTGGGFTIGRDGGTGTLIVETGGSLDIAGNPVGGMGLTAGRTGGTGSIDVRSGGILRIATPSGATTSGSGITLGREAGSTGSMRVDGSTVTLDIDHARSSGFRSGFFVGRGGTGMLDIVNGGTITIDGQEILTTVVQAGGNFSSDPVNRVSGTGRINVTGPGSKLEMRGDDTNIEIGRWGSGSRGDLVVANGGAVAANTLRIGIGQNGAEGATGRVEVTGPGSTVALAGRDVDGDGGQIWLGRDRGIGDLVVRDGARVTLDGSGAATGNNAFINIGGRAAFVDAISGASVAGTSGTGNVLVAGAGSSITFLGAGGAEGGGGSISVGRWGTDTNASMTIADRASVTTTFLTIGRGDSGSDGSRGTMTVDNATLRMTGANAAGSGAFLSVGRDGGGRGTLTIDNGGVVAIDPSAATATGSSVGVSIGRSVGSTGAILVDHGSSLLAARFLGVGTNFSAGAVQETGVGTLVLRNGSNAAATSVQVGAQGSVTIAGGSTLTAQDMVLRGGGSQLVLDDGVLVAQTLEAFSGAGISGIGTLDAATVTLHSGATMGPGFSPGTIRITGDLVTESGSRLVLDYVENPDGSIARDVLEIAGMLSAAGEIEIQLGGSATFADLVGLSLSTFLVDETGVGLGDAYAGRLVTILGADGSARRLSVIDSIIVDGTPVSDVPEPGTLALLLIGGGALAMGRRRHT